MAVSDSGGLIFARIGRLEWIAILICLELLGETLPCNFATCAWINVENNIEG